MRFFLQLSAYDVNTDLAQWLFLELFSLCASVNVCVCACVCFSFFLVGYTKERKVPTCHILVLIYVPISTFLSKLF